MNADILPLSEPYFEELRLAIDTVAREKRFLALTEASPRDEAFNFFRGLVESGSPSVNALHDGHVIGWCDIQFAFGQARRHIGRLGVGLLPQARGQGFGARVMQAVIAKAWNNGLTPILGKNSIRRLVLSGAFRWRPRPALRDVYVSPSRRGSELGR